MTHHATLRQEPDRNRLRHLPVRDLVRLVLVVNANVVDPERRRAAGVPELAELRAELLRREHEVQEVRR